MSVTGPSTGAAAGRRCGKVPPRPPPVQVASPAATDDEMWVWVACPSAGSRRWWERRRSLFENTLSCYHIRWLMCHHLMSMRHHWQWHNHIAKHELCFRNVNHVFPSVLKCRSFWLFSIYINFSMNLHNHNKIYVPRKDKLVYILYIILSNSTQQSLYIILSIKADK
jgi:hypothetical protein